MLVRKRDNRHGKLPFEAVHHRQARPVHRNGTLRDSHVAVFVLIVAETVYPAPVLPLHRRAHRRLVHVPLHDVSVQPVAQLHRTLHIDLRSYFQLAQVGFLQGFVYRRHGVFVPGYIHHRQAHAVVGDALVYFQFPGKIAAHRNVQITALFFQAGHHGHRFHYSCKHICLLSFYLIFILSNPSTPASPSRPNCLNS